MAEIVRRRSWGGVLPLGRHVSISGSSLIQCASASIAPPHPGRAKCYPGAEVQGRTGSSGIDRAPVRVDARGLEVAADWRSLKSAENYVVFERTENFASPGGAVLDKPRTYQLPAMLRLNEWALSGDWTVKKEAAVLHEPNGGTAYRFQARDLALVMAPSAPGPPRRFRVRIDRQPPRTAHGIDVDEQGNGPGTEQRPYQLI